MLDPETTNHRSQCSRSRALPVAWFDFGVIEHIRENRQFGDPDLPILLAVYLTLTERVGAGEAWDHQVIGITEIESEQALDVFIRIGLLEEDAVTEKLVLTGVSQWKKQGARGNASELGAPFDSPEIKYAVGGKDWDGGSRALMEIWDADLGPLPKLLAIYFADSPGTASNAVGWSGATEAKVNAAIRWLLERGWIAEHNPLRPSLGPEQRQRQAERAKLTARLRAEIIERDEMCCGICGDPVEEHEIEIDHIVPISVGGLTIASNLQTAHGRCNRAKGATLPDAN